MSHFKALSCHFVLLLIVLPAILTAEELANDNARQDKVLSGYSGRHAGSLGRAQVYSDYQQQQQGVIPGPGVAAVEEQESKQQQQAQYERSAGRSASNRRRAQNRDSINSRDSHDDKYGADQQEEEYAAGNRRQNGAGQRDGWKMGGRAAIQYPDQQQQQDGRGPSQYRKQGGRGGQARRGERLSLDA